MNDDKKTVDQGKSTASFQWEAVKGWFKSYLLLFTGGSVGLGTAIGFIIYITYCCKIGYMPVLQLRDYADLFLCLTVVGGAYFAAIVLLPFAPGVYLCLTAPKNPSKKFEKGQVKLAIVSFIPGAVLVAAILGAAHCDRLHSILLNGWVTALLILISNGLAVIWYVFVADRVGEGSAESETRTDAAMRALIPTFLYCGIVVAFVQGILGGNVLGGSIPAIAALFGALGMTVMGNLLLAVAGTPERRWFAAFFVGAFAVGVVLPLAIPASEGIVRRFGIASSQPIEFTLKEEDLARVPATIRERLDVRPDLGTRTYAIRGAYLMLRIGSEFRVGITRTPKKERSEENPIRTAWSIPESAVVTWREIEFKEILFPEAGSLDPAAN